MDSKTPSATSQSSATSPTASAFSTSTTSPTSSASAISPTSLNHPNLPNSLDVAPSSSPAPSASSTPSARLLYLGHASLRLETADGHVVYIDPYAGDQYDLPADLILVTHDHYDHNAIDKVALRRPGCRIITWLEALKDGEHQAFEFGYLKVHAVEAGYNKNHDPKHCVGYVLTLKNGMKLYVAGDTSETPQMPALASEHLDYAFYPCDGVFNMDAATAARAATKVGARHNIPYHTKPGALFDRTIAEKFTAPNRLVLEPGQSLIL